MPRGRHRHSPPLHRLLPPSAVAGASVLSAAGAWFLSEPALLRSLTAAAAAAAVSGAVLMRSWDRAAGRKVADLTRGRASDAWQAEERIAELESDIEESRALRARLDAKLRSKRVELAALRGEHAELLRRYATAETERADALEGRRRLAMEVAAPKELSESASATSRATYLRASKALDDLSRNAAAQKARATLEEARDRDIAERTKDARDAREAAGPAAPAGAAPWASAGLAAGTAGETAPKVGDPRGNPVADAEEEQHTRPTAAAVPARRAAPGAAAIVPYGPRRRPVKRRPEGGFDFFGTNHGHPSEGTAAGAGAQKAIESKSAETRAIGTRSVETRAIESRAVDPKAIEAAQTADLADVVGEEALAEQRADAAQRAGTAQGVSPARPVSDVIDLTVHDETEKLDLGRLRKAVSS
ncbi:hypothetical protein ACFYT4_30600 [Streptomyces sp. NPDC004609]|uniref:hypothetical protein n=1 Tax=Streptomyces sp. NPDC004609 TaxID=3364704 RepID=UPI0036A5B8A1